MNENDRTSGAENENDSATPKESGMRGLFGRARSAISEGVDRAQEAATPHVDRAREVVTPHIERAKEAGSTGAERAQEVGAAGAESAQRFAERAVGAEFRREFERYVNAASTIIVGLHQDQVAQEKRIADLENIVKNLSGRLDSLEQ